MSRQVKRIVHQIIPVLSALALLAGCGGEDNAGGAGYEKGLPVVNASALVETGNSKVDFLDAPADVYEGGIQIWFYRDQPFTGWAVVKHPNGKLKRKEFLQTGLMHGVSHGWFKSGQMEFESNWHFGLPDGLEVIWHENGNVYAVNYWQRGVVLIKKAWDENGNVLKLDGWNEDGTHIAATK